MTITKFTDSDNNICCMEYIELGDCFIVCTEELSHIRHKFLPEEVEELLDKGIWSRIQ